MLNRLTQLAIRRPVLIAGAWWTVVGIFAVIGLGVSDRLHRASIEVPGTKAAAASKLVDQRFGPRWPVAVMLDGPPAAVEAQGPRVTRALDRVASVTVFGPWSGAGGSAVHALRPKPGRAVVFATVHRPYEQASKDTDPKLRKALDAATSPPVKARLAGVIDVGDAIQKESISAIERAEIIAAPILMVVLLLVLGTPVAALIPLALGGSVVGFCTGVLDLVNRVTPLDAVSLNLASMMGLALGVDYALLTVARFRRERAEGAEVHDAATTAIATAGRTVRFAGLVLAVAMLAGLVFAPGGLMKSAVVGTLAAVAVSLLSSYTVLPSALVFWDKHLERWPVFRGGASSTRWGRRAFALIRRPGRAAAIVGIALLALAAPALGITAGPPNPDVLPPHTPARDDVDAMKRELGFGWVTPFNITVAVPEGTVTSARRLRALADFERRLGRERLVASVFGPGAIEPRTRALRAIPAQLARGSGQLRSGLSGLKRLDAGLSQAGAGVTQLRSGLAQAAGASDQIAAGGGAARTGSQALADGAAQAATGARSLGAGLSEAAAGTVQLIDGARKEETGAAQLRRGVAKAEAGVRAGMPQIKSLSKQLEDGAKGLNDLREPVQTAQKNLDDALSALQAMLPTSKADPNYARAYKDAATALGAISGKDPTTGAQVQSGYDGLDAELAKASGQLALASAGTKQIGTKLGALLKGLAQLHTGAGALESGAGQLGSGLTRLRSGERRLGDGAGALAGGAAQLSGGADALARGLDRLASGSSDLSSGLRSGYEQSGALTSGIGKLRSGAGSFGKKAGALSGQLAQTRKLGPLFGSGYAVLAALDGASPAQRQAAGFVVNVDRGGTAAQFVVVKKGDAGHAGDPLRGKLEHAAGDLSRKTGAKVAVGGPAGTLQDFDQALHDSYARYIFFVSLLSYLVLVPILRSLVLPALAVGLNLLTVGAAYGVLVLGFVGKAPLGGPGYIDDVMVAAVFNVVFALSIDYEVFLLMRVREGYARFGDTDRAIEYALEHTAGVITGAAAIMTGVFFAFAVSPVTSMRQLGLGLCVAVILDATVVRLILLPACLRLAGRWNWWLPGWLDRVLPHIDFEGSGARRGARPKTDW